MIDEAPMMCAAKRHAIAPSATTCARCDAERRGDRAQRLLDMIERHEREAWNEWFAATLDAQSVRNNRESTIEQIDAAGKRTNHAHARLCEARKTLNAALAEVSVMLRPVAKVADGH